MSGLANPLSPGDSKMNSPVMILPSVSAAEMTNKKLSYRIETARQLRMST